MENDFLKKKDFLRWSSLKKTVWAMAVACACMLGTSCDDAEGRIEVDDTAPEQVTDVKAVSGPGEVTLSWTNPTSPSFMYTKIVYTNSKGEEQYMMVAKDKEPTATVKGFANTDTQTFLLYACSVKGNNAGAVEVTGTPDTPAFLEVVNTITVEPVLGGALVNYKNDFATEVVIALEYYQASDEGKSGSARFNVPANSEGSQLVMLVDANNEFLEGECVISLTAQDEFENSSVPVQQNVTPLPAVKIDRTLWSFPGYVENSNDGTIGYSSQEAQGEGDKDGLKNGRVVSMIDSSLNTYWHASWKVATNYPHWFILDMGREVTIASVEFTRRQGDARGQTGQHIYTCTEAGASDPSNPDNWAWTDHGSFPFDPNIDTPQTCGLSTTPKARYIKVYFGTEHKGTGSQAMLADLNVYGAEE